MTAMNESRISVKSDGNEIVLAFSGAINENADFSTVSLGSQKTVVFDLGDVKLINSVGIREWIIWMKGNVFDKVCIFRKCPKVIVDQINILDGFLPPASFVESFYVPYVCKSCDDVGMTLFESGKEFRRGTADAEAEIQPPEKVNCKACGEEMEMDVLRNLYFHFLRYRPRC